MAKRKSQVPSIQMLTDDEIDALIKLFTRFLLEYREERDRRRALVEEAREA